MRKTIFLVTFLLGGLLLSGCLFQPKYSTSDECYLACEKKGYIDGICKSEKEAGEDEEGAGNCLIRRQDENCGRPGQCVCFCAGKVEENEVAMVLKDLENETKIDFSKITDRELEWNVLVSKAADNQEETTKDEDKEAGEGDEVKAKEEKQLGKVLLLGMGFEAKGISQTQYLSIELYLENSGFELDSNNVSMSAVSGSKGYKKEDMVCLVTGGMSGYKEVGSAESPAGDETDEVNEETNKFDAEVVCALAEEEALNPTVSGEEAIKNLLALKYNKETSDVLVTIENETENHARGSVKFGEGKTAEGGIFLATDINGEWQIVYDGNGQISCEQLKLYDFPDEMTKDCVNSQTIETGVDEEFSIVLAADETSGYEWGAEFDEGMIELLERNYKASDDKSAEAGGNETFDFKALKAGEAEITFSYGRPEESKQPAEKRMYVVEIK